MDVSRRHFLRGTGLVLAAPAIVKITSIMPVKVMPDELTIKCYEHWGFGYNVGYHDPRTIWLSLPQLKTEGGRIDFDPTWRTHG